MADTAKAPLIGVAGPRRWRWDLALIHAGLRRQGARTLALYPGGEHDWQQLHGLVLAGGAHIHPRRYRSTPTISARYNEPRDALELSLLAHARAHNLPVLGICRGAQLLNVFHGGTLHQNITPLRRNTRPRHLVLPMQRVSVMPNSTLGQVLRHDQLGANRLHSQSVLRLGRGLRVSARDPDQFVQAVESVQPPWRVGVQWHPEYLFYHPAHRRLFKALVTAARKSQSQEY